MNQFIMVYLVQVLKMRPMKCVFPVPLLTHILKLVIFMC